MTNLLLVEDSRLIRTAMRRILIEAGYCVVDVSDGEEALQVARHSKLDLIILDMLLPKMRGELLLRSLKQDPTTTHIPVLVVSSLSQSNADKLENFLRLVHGVLRKATPIVPLSKSR
jgi:CheY-like chemotaxis protein